MAAIVAMDFVYICRNFGGGGVERRRGEERSKAEKVKWQQREMLQVSVKTGRLKGRKGK